jgi:siroheme decarboxylase
LVLCHEAGSAYSPESHLRPHYYRVLRQEARKRGEEVDYATYGLDAVTRGCLGGTSFCFISHVGVVQPCGYLELNCGDLKKASFRDVWETRRCFGAFEIFPLTRASAAGASICGFAAVAVPGPTRQPVISWKKNPFACINRLGERPMDELDRKILNSIQSEFPVAVRPYGNWVNAWISRRMRFFLRVKRLKEEGVIRRIGGNFHSSKLDFASTLCAAKVPEENLKRFVEVVNRYPGVTHNYLRNHEYNVWFTFIAPSMGAIEEALQEISKITGVKKVHSLPALRMFKIKVDFEV